MSESLRIVIPTEQRSMLGHLLPCEYIFSAEPIALDDGLVDWARHNGLDVAEFDGAHQYLAMPPTGITGWHIVPISFQAERLAAGDRITTCIDMNLIERVIRVAEMSVKR